jgi:hypothetical protein
MRPSPHGCPRLFRAILPALLAVGAVRAAPPRDDSGPTQGITQVGALEDDGRPAIPPAANRPPGDEPRAPSAPPSGPPSSRPAEVPGPPPGPGTFWVAGTYVPSGAGVAWRPGFWAAAQPGWTWAPARWVQGASGPAFVEGRWERTSTPAPVATAPAGWPASAAFPPPGRAVVRPRNGPGAAVSRLLNGNRGRAARGRR